VGGSNPAKTKGLKNLSLSRKDKQREGMPIKGHGREFTRRGKKKTNRRQRGEQMRKQKRRKGGKQRKNQRV
jgi:hypothetical protein